MTNVRPTTPSPRDAGFSLIELLVATLIALALIGAVLTAVGDAQRRAQIQPETIDLTQRLRTGWLGITDVVADAGTASDLGCSGLVLGRAVAAVRPYRLGLRRPAMPGTFDPGAVTVWAIPPDARVAVTAVPLVSSGAIVTVEPTQGSSLTSPSLGFEAGMCVMVSEPRGVLDLFRVVDVSGTALQLEQMGPGLSAVYQPGACVTEAVSTSLVLDPDPEQPGASRLMRYDGYKSEQPVLDHVVVFSVRYFGDARPPEILRDASESALATTSYGPAPPSDGVDEAADSWPAGENCVFTRSAAGPVSRLASLGPLAPLVPLDPFQLTDGPWCPDGGVPGAFDADLLRVRRIVLTLRLEVRPWMLRGAGGPLFVRPGTSSSMDTMVPDLSMQVDLVPRNLAAGR